MFAIKVELCYYNNASMQRKELNKMAKETTIDLILQDPKFIELAVKVMEMEPDYEEDWLIPFEPDEKDEETGVSIVKSRKGDYGQQISYVPAKYVRQRLDLAFNKKWTFFIVAEHRETEPFQKWSKQEEDYVDGSNYLKCIGMMVIPGFGIRMEYGVKKVYGDAESSDWKACKTDAFKKCAEAFGIYLNYADDDADDEEESGGRRGKGKKGGKVDLSDVEYTDDDLEDAFEEVLTFGKYKDYSLKEIFEEEDDISYIEWLAENANDDDMRFFASVVLKYNEEQEEEKSSRRRGKGSSKGNKGRSSGRSSGNGGSSKRGKGKKDDNYMNPPEDDDEEEEEEKPKRGRGNKSGSKSSGRKGKSVDDDEDEKEQLMEDCRNALDDYDKVQQRSMMTSVSVSNRYPKGKTKLEQFTLSELQELAEVLDIGGE